MHPPGDHAVAFLRSAERVVEIGIGDRPAFAGALAREGVDVIATDIHPRTLPPEIRFVRDDITDPDVSIYAGADALYARRLPPELHHPAVRLARHLDIDLYFTTLGFEVPEVPVESVDGPPGGWFVWRRTPAADR